MCIYLIAIDRRLIQKWCVARIESSPWLTSCC